VRSVEKVFGSLSSSRKTHLLLWLPWLLAAGAPTGAAVELAGTTRATLAWEDASGPVVGYVVYITLNDAPQQIHSIVATNGLTVGGSVGDEFTVRVAGIDGENNLGPLSPSSDLIRFVAEQESEPAPDPEPEPIPDEEPPRGDEPPVEIDALATTLDFDGDGVSDVLLRNEQSGEMEIWLMEGGRIAAMSPLPALPAGWSVVGNGDYDGDGFADVLCRSDDTGRLDLWLVYDGLVIGGGALGDASDLGWEVVASGDFDGDGDADVLLRNLELRALEIWSLDDSGAVAITSLAGDPGETWSAMGSGDYDGDGVSDVLWRRASGRTKGRRSDTQTLEVWFLEDLAVVDAIVLAEDVTNAIAFVGSGDYDGNGQNDLLWRRTSSGRTGIFMLNDDLTFGSEMISRKTRTHQHLVGSGDFDGDGNTDLLVEDTEARRLYVYLMSGSRVLATPAVADLGPGWHVVGAGE
jgi:hypothetical protein